MNLFPNKKNGKPPVRLTSAPNSGGAVYLCARVFIAKGGHDHARGNCYRRRQHLAGAQHQRRVVTRTTEKRSESKDSALRLGHRLARPRRQNSDQAREELVPGAPKGGTGYCDFCVLGLIVFPGKTRPACASVAPTASFRPKLQQSYSCR
jgi:hypothetical protein